MHLPQTSTRYGPKRVLILGGTSEAFRLAELLAHRPGLTIISSLAGRIDNPRLPAGIVRVGGFGGLSGLTSYLVDEKIRVVIDATHPFAAKISVTAETACDALGIPLIAFERPPWTPLKDDLWRSVPDVRAAAVLANRKGSRIFLSIGRQELGAFSDCDEAWFLVRAIDRPEARLPPNSRLILDRGPFHLCEELKMFRGESISCVVSKNSGGTSTYPKIEAARSLRIPVVMIERPIKHKICTISQTDDVLAMLTEMIDTLQDMDQVPLED